MFCPPGLWVTIDTPLSVAKSNTRPDDPTPNDPPRSSTAPFAYTSHGLSTSAHAVPATDATLLSTPARVRPALANDGNPNASLSTIPNHPTIIVPSPPPAGDDADAHRPFAEHTRVRDPTRKLSTTISAL
jgi:hypothetical protein